MSDRLEWAHVTSDAELLYPGSDIDEAVVDPGEIAVALWTGSNGIALHGSRQRVLDRLLQLAAAVLDAPPVPIHEACIAEQVDMWYWEPDGPVLGPLPPAAPAPTWCGETRPVAADPRLATCPQCIETWNDLAPRTPLNLSHPIAALS
ncbi:hypothetical protein ACFY1P_20775 [Streptomyces sp. NPDC001407]|uniref:hypothetical protein n=1 Tax=Streptomyces sp. NPDC001407 TaxID=3364573 RepID=UPI0036841E66